jgi:LysM repeat protein
MGIITNEQAGILADQLGKSGEESKAEIKKSETVTVKSGDTFLLCTNGLTDIVEEESIFEAVADGQDAGIIANSLVREALRGGGDDNVTVVVVKVADIEGEEEVTGTPDKRDIPAMSKFSRQNPRIRRSVDSGSVLKKAASTAAAVLLVAAAVFGVYKLWMFMNSKDLGVAVLEPEHIEQTSGQSPEEASPTPGASLETGAREDSALQQEDSALGEGNTENDVSDADTNEAKEQEQKYEVKPGDSLFTISKKFYNDPNKYKLIMEANDIKDPDRIKAGQILIIPGIDQQ